VTNRPHLSGALRILLLCCLVGCGQKFDGGLSPPTDITGFSGTIYFKNWPDGSLLYELRMVAFNTYPSDSALIIQDVAYGEVAVYPPIGPPNLLKDTTLHLPGADSIRYVFTTLGGTNLKPGLYPYVALAWRYGPNFLSDWRPAGLYTQGPGPFDAAPVRVLLHQITPNIDFTADFANPPPKPWR